MRLGYARHLPGVPNVINNVGKGRCSHRRDPSHLPIGGLDSERLWSLDAPNLD